MILAFYFILFFFVDFKLTVNFLLYKQVLSKSLYKIHVKLFENFFKTLTTLKESWKL